MRSVFWVDFHLPIFIYLFFKHLAVPPAFVLSEKESNAIAYSSSSLKEVPLSSKREAIWTSCSRTVRKWKYKTRYSLQQRHSVRRKRSRSRRKARARRWTANQAWDWRLQWDRYRMIKRILSANQGWLKSVECERRIEREGLKCIGARLCLSCLCLFEHPRMGTCRTLSFISFSGAMNAFLSPTSTWLAQDVSHSTLSWDVDVSIESRKLNLI